MIKGLKTILDLLSPLSTLSRREGTVMEQGYCREEGGGETQGKSESPLNWRV